MPSDIRIGISGWTYPPWRGTFFPAGLKQREELAYASRQVRSIEINGTFYSLQKPASYALWAAQVPDDFIFAVKAPRSITHIRRLKEVAVPLANFFASGPLRLGPKLGPILWQLPPHLPYDRERLSRFFALLPRDTAGAVEVARKHDAHVAMPWIKTDATRPLRHALEVRHASFKNPEFIALLREHDIAIVVADTAGKWPLIEDITANFIYVRLHGDEELYVSGYTPDAIGAWAKKIEAWSAGKNPADAATLAAPAPAARQGRDVFVYFDNDVKVRAPYDAMTLAHRLGLGPAPAESPPVAPITETARTVWPGFPSRSKPGKKTKAITARTRDPA